MGGRGGAPMRAQSNAPGAAGPDGMSAEEKVIRELVQTASRSDTMGGRGEAVSITSIRRRLDARGWSREKQNKEFTKLASKATFIPQSDQKFLTRQQREDFFYQGGQPKSWMRLDDA